MPKFSRQHYSFIVEQLATSYSNSQYYDDVSFLRAVEDWVDRLKEDNPAFDPFKFCDAVIEVTDLNIDRLSLISIPRCFVDWKIETMNRAGQLELDNLAKEAKA